MWRGSSALSAGLLAVVVLLLALASVASSVCVGPITTIFIDDPECFQLDYSNVSLTPINGNPTAIAYLRDLVRSDPILAARAGQLGAIDDSVFSTILLQTGVYGGLAKLESPMAVEVASAPTLKDATDVLWKLVLYNGLDNVNRCPPGVRFDITSASGTIVGKCVPDIPTDGSFFHYQVIYIVGIALDIILHIALFAIFFYYLFRKSVLKRE